MAGTRILVIDDDWAFIQHAQCALAEVGEVRAVTCGLDGLSTVERWDPDVVMLDLLLSDVDGFALLDRLTAGDPHHRPAVLCLIAGHGAGMRPARAADWPVGTLVRTAPADQIRSAVRHAAQARQGLRSAAGTRPWPQASASNTSGGTLSSVPNVAPRAAISSMARCESPGCTSTPRMASVSTVTARPMSSASSALARTQ